MSSRDPEILSDTTGEPCTSCAPDGTGGLLATTWFCSLHCQSEYEPAHKAACRAADCRRTLYRAGRTTQLIFQCCQEALSKICIARVEKRGEDLYVHQASNIKKQDLPSVGKNETALPSLKQHEDTTPSFSRRIQASFSSVFDTEDDKEAAIACMASGVAIPYVRALLEHVHPDNILRFARVDHTVKEPPRRVIMIQPDGTEINNASQPHSVLQITLQNLEASAIDVRLIT